MATVRTQLPSVFETPDLPWPSFWVVVGDEPLGWKDTRAWHVFYRATGAKGHQCYRERIVRCGGAASAIKACQVATAGLFVELEIVHVQPPPTRMEVKELERINAWIREKWKKPAA